MTKIDKFAWWENRSKVHEFYLWLVRYSIALEIVFYDICFVSVQSRTATGYLFFSSFSTDTDER